MDNIKDLVVKEILEGLNDFTGNDFSFRHDEDTDTLEATHYNENGVVIGIYNFTVKVEMNG